METIDRIWQQENTYSNGAGSDGRRFSRILLTEQEAVDLRDALGEAAQ